MHTKMLVLPFILGLAAHGQTSVTVKGYDAVNSNEDRTEKIFTPTTVAKGMRRLPDIPCIGDARGCESEPIIDAQLNIMILASEGGVIRGVVPDGGAGVWQTAVLCFPVDSDRSIDMWKINQHISFMSTSVEDFETKKLYAVATCSEDGSGSPVSIRQHLFVLDMRTGNVLTDLLLDGTDKGQTLSTIPRKQRSGLKLTKSDTGVKFVWVCFGSYSETGRNSAGFILGVDTFDNKVKMTWASSQGLGAGIWMSSQPPIFANGLLYFFTGNGAYDGVKNFGEAAVILKPTYPKGNTPGKLEDVSSWARFSDAGRVGKDPTKSSPALEAQKPLLLKILTLGIIHNKKPVSLDKDPTVAKDKLAGVNEATQMAPTLGAPMLKADMPGGSMPMAGDPNQAFGDNDDGLSHTFFADINKWLTCGKDGICVVFDGTTMLRTLPKDFANAKLNCSKLAAGPYGLGYNLGIDLCPQDETALNIFAGGKTRHIHGPISQLHTATGRYALVQAENSGLQVWSVANNGTMSYIGRSLEQASASITTGQGGMPGGFSVVTSNNGNNAIAWVSMPDGDANRTITTGHVYAYDLTGLAQLSGNKIIPLLWKSEEFTYSKFSAPEVSDGKLFLCNYNGSCMLWKSTQ